MANTGQGNFEKEKVKVIFNRDILINESESITNCKNSVGILSEETIVSQHPWTSDVQTELKRIEEQKKAEIDQYNEAFPNDTNGGDLNATQ